MNLFFTWVNTLHCTVLGLSATVSASNTLQSFVGRNTLLDGIHELAHVNELVAANLVVLVKEHLGDVAFGELQVACALGLGAVEGTHLRNETLAKVLEACTYHQATLGEGALCATIDNLEEELTHSCVDSVTNEVCVESLKDCLSWEDFRSHSC